MSVLCLPESDAERFVGSYAGGSYLQNVCVSALMQCGSAAWLYKGVEC